jgi:hypothetical protein
MAFAFRPSAIFTPTQCNTFFHSAFAVWFYQNNPWNPWHNVLLIKFQIPTPPPPGGGETSHTFIG